MLKLVRINAWKFDKTYTFCFTPITLVSLYCNQLEYKTENTGYVFFIKMRQF